MNIKDEQLAFEEWFASVWVGEPPTIQDPGYGEYLEARQLALGAWMHRAQIAATDVAVEKSWQRFEDKMAELGREKTVAAAPPPPVQHSDDVAVDRFAAAMKAKLAQKRAENMTLRNQRDELRIVLDKRPAMNAGLLDSYAAWSASVYALDWLDADDDAMRKEGDDAR